VKARRHLFNRMWIGPRGVEKVNQLLDDYRNEILQEVAEQIRSTYYGCEGATAFDAASLVDSMKS
jgi:hypothetical protein